MKKIVFFLVASILLSCTQQSKNQTKQPAAKSLIKYAKGIDIQEFNGYYLLSVTTPYQNSNHGYEYVLAKKGFDKKSYSGNAEIIDIPIKSIVPTSTTHIPMIEALNKEQLITGFPNLDYISSEKTRTLIKTGQIRELGIDANLNTEVMLEMTPDVIVGFSVNGSNKSLETLKRNGLAVIYNGAWLEETPLGRAEWIKFFGLLFDDYELADAKFKEIESRYHKVKQQAATMDSDIKVLTGAMFKDIWNVPAGESFVAQFLSDANVNYIWKDTEGKGSLQLSFETVLDKGKDADLWIGPGAFSTKEELVSSNTHYMQFDAFTNDQLYTFANTKGETGGLLYFELGALRPDLILSDVIKIAHPTLLQDYEFTFFEKMK